MPETLPVTLEDSEANRDSSYPSKIRFREPSARTGDVAIPAVGWSVAIPYPRILLADSSHDFQFSIYHQQTCE